MTAASRRGLLLDRDGVINHDFGFVSRIADCRFIDGIFELARAFAARGFIIAIVTNQSGIGRGYYSEADFLELTGWMRSEFMRRGVEIAATYHCPDHPTHGIGRHRRETPWRKPGPGMFLQAAADLSLDLARSWTIGDKQSDIAAGRAAGVGTLVLLDPATGETRRDGDVWVVPNLGAATELLHSTPAG
jgi:D-glycero-D-manno-heptose 1,7-bisphosphate phosphatase